GFLISSYVCLTSVVLVDMVGVDKLTSAFGLLLLIQGIATFVGPPIAGKFLYILTLSLLIYYFQVSCTITVNDMIGLSDSVVYVFSFLESCCLLFPLFGRISHRKLDSRTEKT